MIDPTRKKLELTDVLSRLKHAEIGNDLYIGVEAWPRGAGSVKVPPECRTIFEAWLADFEATKGASVPADAGMGERHRKQLVHKLRLHATRDDSLLKLAADEIDRLAARPLPPRDKVREALEWLDKIVGLIDDEEVAEPLDDAIKYANNAIRALAALPPAQKKVECFDITDEWQPIETAPPDQEVEIRGIWQLRGDGIKITHWRPAVTRPHRGVGE